MTGTGRRDSGIDTKHTSDSGILKLPTRRSEETRIPPAPAHLLRPRPTPTVEDGSSSHNVDYIHLPLRAMSSNPSPDTTTILPSTIRIPPRRTGNHALTKPSCSPASTTRRSEETRIPPAARRSEDTRTPDTVRIPPRRKGNHALTEMILDPLFVRDALGVKEIGHGRAMVTLELEDAPERPPIDDAAVAIEGLFQGLQQRFVIKIRGNATDRRVGFSAYDGRTTDCREIDGGLHICHRTA